MDESLAEQQGYIEEYIKTNFNLIEDGQYSFPISGTLLGFFKMSSQIMIELYSDATGEAAKIGKLLLFRGLLENYHQIIEELKTDLAGLAHLERNANLILKLVKAPEAGGPAYVEKVPSSAQTATSARIEVGGTLESPMAPPVPGPAVPAVPAVPTAPAAQGGMFPELGEKYRNKKFNFMEGIILQYCDGQTVLDEIVAKSKYSKQEVVEVLDTYEKKGWLVIHRRSGGKSFGKLMDAVKTTQKAIVSEAQKPSDVSSAEAESPEVPTKIYPELLEKYRTKKFNFKEGIVLQHCDGKLTVAEIVEKSNFSEEEVLEIINTYQKKEWLVIHT
jgi:hypothetical protein